jgi:hypothetical protein
MQYPCGGGPAVWYRLPKNNIGAVAGGPESGIAITENTSLSFTFVI